jgi:3-oxoacyl-[acyl-carrier protein] reductase
MSLNFSNKVFLIVGSTKGIGKDIGLRLLDSGAIVIFTGSRSSSLNSLKKIIDSKKIKRCSFYCGDLSKTINLNKLKKDIIVKWGKLDGLVANIGNTKKMNSILDIKQSEWDWFMKNNFFSTYNAISVFSKLLIKSCSSVVIIGSIAGIKNIHAPLPYSIAKNSLSFLNEILSDYFSKHLVRVNIVHPGNILFKGGKWDKKLKKDKGKIVKYINENVPLKKFGDTSDIAKFVIYLLSNDAKFITGSSFIIDGGQTLKK